jgi:hypothetical protein
VSSMIFFGALVDRRSIGINRCGATEVIRPFP